jgi:hypothetical protein
MATWAPFAAYTMVHSARLAEQHASGGTHTLCEGKRWVTAARLWRESTRQPLPMAVIFSAGETDKGLIYWGCVDSIDVDDDGTTCTNRTSSQSSRPGAYPLYGCEATVDRCRTTTSARMRSVTHPALLCSDTSGVARGDPR